MKKRILLLTGMLLVILGLFFQILYLNLLVLGYSFSFYVHFISRKVEFYFLGIGILCLIIYLKRKDHQ